MHGSTAYRKGSVMPKKSQKPYVVVHDTDGSERHFVTHRAAMRYASKLREQGEQAVIAGDGVAWLREIRAYLQAKENRDRLEAQAPELYQLLGELAVTTDARAFREAVLRSDALQADIQHQLTELVMMKVMRLLETD